LSATFLRAIVLRIAGVPGSAELVKFVRSAGLVHSEGIADLRWRFFSSCGAPPRWYAFSGFRFLAFLGHCDLDFLKSQLNIGATFLCNYVSNKLPQYRSLANDPQFQVWWRP